MLKNKTCRIILLFAAYAAILFLLYSKYYFADLLPFSGDGVNSAVEQLFIKESLENGDGFPLWNKWLAGGIPYTVTISPLALLSILPVKEMLYALYIVPVALGAVFFYLYLREIHCSGPAALTISTCFLLSIHLGGARKSHSYIIIACALLPIILYCIERYFSTGKLRWLLTSSCIMALQVLCGQFQHAVYADIFLVCYLLAFGIHYKMKVATMFKHGLLWGFTYLGLIAVRLVPMLEEQIAFSDAGWVKTSYTTFTSYSIHPIKLIMMVFPRFFNGKGMGFGVFHSSEQDFEIFLGFMILCLALAAFLLCFRNFRVRFCMAAILITFLYAAMGNIPPLAELLYRIPYIRDFRVASRALYIGIFLTFTLAAIALTSLSETSKREKFLKLYSRGTITVIGVVCVMVLVIVLAIGVPSDFADIDSFETFMQYVNKNLLPDILWMLLSLVLLFGIHALWKNRPTLLNKGICLVVLVTVLGQTLPFSLWTNPASISELKNTDPAAIQLANEIGNYKIWDDTTIPAGESEMIRSSKGMVKRIAAINAYIPFNNPYLYRLLTQVKEVPMNASALLTASPKALQNLQLQNALLSMLGVKYIIDTSGMIAEDASFYQLNETGETVYAAEEVRIPDSDGALAVQFEAFQPEANTWYQIQFSCETTQSEIIDVDLYGGHEYDSGEQEVQFKLQPGAGTYSAFMNSGDCDSFEGIVWRILSWSEEDLQLKHFSIIKHEKALVGKYVPWNPELAQNIYVNEKARDILYVPDAIQQISDSEHLYQDSILYSMDRINYMENCSNQTLEPQTTSIENIDFRSNAIRATVRTKEDTFINFSQCYYPGWKAYIDGQQTRLHMVNGLIMGAEVPAGEHEVQFSYRPASFAIGIALTLGTLFLLILAGCRSVRKKGRQGTIRPGRTR